MKIKFEKIIFYIA